MNTHHFPQRVAHALNLLAILALTASGFYIHRPSSPGLMGQVRYLHYIAGFVLLLNLAVRVYYAFFGRYRDYQEFKPNWRGLLQQIKYYFFLTKHEVKDGLYNPLQRLAYLGVVLLIVLQGITGFALGWPGGAMAFLVNLLGLAEIRAIHYLFTWVFITFIIIHLYLIFTEAPQALVEMFWRGKETNLNTGLNKKVARERI
ncbi:Ni/Fe-hydrogenase, b-type cytochrome subunit [Paradesulfitobacterium ferrireducens]|uniref:Ni/Fe-hydrogenase, b-type cytochrome subunit n=1 Tax=Paradesulfitobacterium ferrireducens TaxID=2816476 RepID=UPI001A8F3406|nr:Ni/Fe-hydrogenase, b-type cytochrome subunit [Paradesulfitobacterium ferrireducens]